MKLGREVNVDKLGDLLVLIAADCVAMFPSMDAENTARIVAKLYLESDLKIGTVNWKELSRYAYLMTSPSECRQWGIDHLLPTRRFKHGPTPGIKSADIRTKKVNSAHSGYSQSMSQVRWTSEGWLLLP